MSGKGSSTEGVPVPASHEEVPAGEFSPLAQYRCARCGQVFISIHYQSLRMATGRTVEHCGTAAWWLRNIKKVTP